MLNAKQQAILALWQQVNVSLSAYNKLIEAFSSAENAMQASSAEWRKLGLHASHIERHQDTAKTEKFLAEVNNSLEKGDYQLLFFYQDEFPKQLNELFDPPPLLFVRGNIARLQEAQIAMVGSRKPTPHAQKITFDMAQYLAQMGYIITSGLAQGVDYHAHKGALTQADNLLKGRTIGVMGTGIDVCYPRHNNSLFQQIIDDGGCLISELLPKTIASKHTFPRRNRIVAGLSLGTIVTEATIKSGSLITARLTSEQGKQVFAVPSHIDNHNAEGCHHLIREGATLIYHPTQVIEDLRYQQMQPIVTPKTTENKASNPTNNQVEQNEPPTSSKLPLANTELPPHLDKLFANIDWTGVDIDKLITMLQLDTQTLLGQLMELELLGLIRQQGGRYVRV